MIDEPTIRRLYVQEQRSIRAIATLLQVPTRLVYDALVRYRIPRRTTGFRPQRVEPDEAPFDEITLRRWYLEEECSIRTIAKRTNVSTRVVYEALIHYNIPRRKVGQRPADTLAEAEQELIDESTLRRLYEGEGRSIAAIATTLACSPARIRSALVYWGIERRRRGRPSGATSGID